ncbi:hypothetical protein ACLN19_09070, partial [Streptococcus sp. zg-JUN1979]
AINTLYHKCTTFISFNYKLRYVGLNEKGQLKKIDLEGEETFDKHGIATVVIDNVAPHITIDYMTGKVTGDVYVRQESSGSKKSDSAELDRDYEQYDYCVYVNEDDGYYDYKGSDSDKYVEMTEREALEEGYVWDAAE